MTAGIGGTALGLPMIWVRRRKPVSGSLCMVDCSRPSYDGAILISPTREKTELGFTNTEFGKAVLFHAGFQRIWDFSKHLCNCFIGHIRIYIFGQFSYLAGSTFATWVDC